MADYVTPEQFGADGTAVNDTAGIQAAANTGLPVMFQSRVYLLADTGAPNHGIVIWGGSGQTWIGAGRGKTILRVSAPTSYDPIFINDNPPISIQGMTFDAAGNLGVGNSRYPDFCAPLFVNNVEGDVRGCEFINFHTCGLNWNEAKNAIIQNNMFSRFGGPASSANHSIHCFGKTGDVFCNVQIDGNRLNDSGLSIAGNHFRIRGNAIRNWGFSCGINFQFNDHHMIATENHIDGGGAKPPDIFGTVVAGIEQWASESIIANNIVENCSGNGIGAGAQRCVISGNICRNNGQLIVADHDNRSGIVLAYVDSVHNGNNTMIVGNSCYDTQTTKTQEYGFREAAARQSGIVLNSNLFRDNKLGAISLQPGSTVRLCCN